MMRGKDVVGRQIWWICMVCLNAGHKRDACGSNEYVIAGFEIRGLKRKVWSKHGADDSPRRGCARRPSLRLKPHRGAKKVFVFPALFAAAPNAIKLRNLKCAVRCKISVENIITNEKRAVRYVTSPVSYLTARIS
jgi:hypothetical protein